MLQSLFYLTIALHVSGIIVTHLEEHKATATTAPGNRCTVLLSVDIVEELELIFCIFIYYSMSYRLNSVNAVLF
jgi:hypothetical protein